MTIGLSVKQIRKLAKGTYSDKQLGKHTRGAYKSGDLWWTNGAIVLFEPVPESVEVVECPAKKIVEYAGAIGQMIKRCRYQVYPVEVSPWNDSKRKLAFESVANRVVVDARYAATVLATKRVGRKRDPGVRWYTDFQGEMLMAVNGRHVGIIIGIEELPEVEPPEWNFRYTGELPS